MVSDPSLSALEAGDEYEFPPRPIGWVPKNKIN
jgi:hypothetical protein